MLVVRKKKKSLKGIYKEKENWPPQNACFRSLRKNVRLARGQADSDFAKLKQIAKTSFTG